MNHKENTIKKSQITTYKSLLNQVPKHPPKTPTQKRPKILSTQKPQNTNQIKSKKHKSTEKITAKKIK
jgi:hypothetical protein